MIRLYLGRAGTPGNQSNNQRHRCPTETFVTNRGHNSNHQPEFLEQLNYNVQPDLRIARERMIFRAFVIWADSVCARSKRAQPVAVYPSCRPPTSDEFLPDCAGRHDGYTAVELNR